MFINFDRLFFRDLVKKKNGLVYRSIKFALQIEFFFFFQNINFEIKKLYYLIFLTKLFNLFNFNAYLLKM